MPSFNEIGPLVTEKTFEGFLPYMGMAAILIMMGESIRQKCAKLQFKQFFLSYCEETLSNLSPGSRLMNKL